MFSFRAYFDQTIAKLGSFARLKPGWHYGEGVPPAPEALKKAIEFSQLIAPLGATTIDAFPGIGGDVGVIFWRKGHQLDFNFETDGTITFCHEQDGEEIKYLEGLSWVDALAEIHDFLARERQETVSTADGVG